MTVCRQDKGERQLGDALDHAVAHARLPLVCYLPTYYYYYALLNA